MLFLANFGRFCRPATLWVDIAYEKYMKRQISKEEYRHSKIMPIYSLGEACRYGNRLFDFDLNECKIVFKPSKNIHIPIEFKPTK